MVGFLVLLHFDIFALAVDVCCCCDLAFSDAPGWSRCDVKLEIAMQATKAVKGTLNKLTPEKFERLLQQLVDVVTSADILHTTISLVFESAVAQPTFVAMYADLCDRLSKVTHDVGSILLLST